MIPDLSNVEAWTPPEADGAAPTPLSRRPDLLRAWRPFLQQHCRDWRTYEMNADGRHEIRERAGFLLDAGEDECVADLAAWAITTGADPVVALAAARALVLPSSASPDTIVKED